MAACRSTPVAPPTEPMAEIPEADRPQDGGPEIAMPSVSPAETASKPAQETITRNLPESRIGKPEKDLAARRVEYNTVLSTRANGTSRNESAWRYRTTRQGEIVGFEFSNYGGNRVLPPRRDAAKNQFFTRDFQFRFDERARQDIYLLVSDWVASRDRTFRLSELMNRLMLFFPRNFLPAIVNARTRNIVTLPTGEEVEFDAATNEIIGGTLSETPVDLNPDRATRQFPGVRYLGKGVVIRADARGADPRIGSTAVISNGIASQDCAKAVDCNLCQVPARELWEQSGAARFKFATDGELDRFLFLRCGFGLPKVGAEYAVAAPQH